MSKTYSPLRPKPRRTPPSWVCEDNRTHFFATADTEWEGIVHVDRAPCGCPTQVAWRDARGLWRVVSLTQETQTRARRTQRTAQARA